MVAIISTFITMYAMKYKDKDHGGRFEKDINVGMIVPIIIDIIVILLMIFRYIKKYWMVKANQLNIYLLIRLKWYGN